MWPYLALGSAFALPACFGGRRVNAYAWGALFVATLIFVGFRHHVGMDWNNYLRIIYSAEYNLNSSAQVLDNEPVYRALLLFGIWTGWGIYATNFVSSFAALLGPFLLAQRTKEPWLALMAAMPFFIIVTAMSANRQALAIGLLMIVFAYWNRLGIAWKVLLILFCAGAHNSAIVFLALVGFDPKVPRYMKAILVIVLVVVSYYVLLGSESLDEYQRLYIGDSGVSNSDGAWIHVALNAVPAAIYLLFRRRLDPMIAFQPINYMAYAAVLTLFIVPFASTAASRLSLYLVPVSMFVWAASPTAFTPRSGAVTRIGIVIALFTVMVGWLSFANNASAHFPYRNALLMEPRKLEIGILP